jgi:pyruvate kinase
VRSQLTLVWGVETFVVPMVGHTDEMVHQVERALLDLGRAKEGDLVCVVAGTPPGRRGTTNMLKIHRLGDST